MGDGIKIDIVGFGATSKETIKQISLQSYNPYHNHTWAPIKDSSDVICGICGIKAMQSASKFK